jgi:hypothetical protein
MLFDPSLKMGTDVFVYMSQAWASLPSHPDSDDIEVLHDFNVVSITHSKSLDTTAHEFLVIATVDKNDKPRRFILERTVDPAPVESAPPTSVLETIEPASSPLASLKEGSSAERLSSEDLVSIGSTQSTHIITQSCKKLDSVNAADWFLGENYLRLPYYQAQNVNFFEPNDLTLFQFAILANEVHKLYPKYTLFDSQCYFYVALVYAAAHQHFKKRPSDETAIDSHLPDRFGCCNSMKVNKFDPLAISAAIGEYKVAYTRLISEVKFMIIKITIFYYCLILYRLTKVGKDIGTRRCGKR